MARTNTNAGTTGITSVTGSFPIVVDYTDPLVPNITFGDTYASSVNGQTGAVSLTTTDIPEGLNLYFTTERAVDANTGLWVGLTGNETVDGVKNFNDFPTKAGSLTPTLPQEFTPKDYVDAFALGFRFKQSVQAATTVPLPTATYNNGAGGVGATLTADANGALPDIDTYVVQLGDRLLIKDQVDPIENGIYDVTDLGSAGTPWILTRAVDFDSTFTIGQGSACLVLNGTAYNPPSTYGNYASQFAVLTADPITVGVDQIIWSRISLPLQYFAGTGLILTGTTFSVDMAFSPITVAYGTTLYSSGLSGTGTGNSSGNNIIFGVNAGFNALNVFNSIFLGTDAGNDATNAFQSVFIGNQTGMQATYAQSSTFLGTGAGFNATSAAGSVMVGRDSGSGATGAFSANFIGNSSGANATGAQHANFFGIAAGQNATNAYYSTFIGDQAGQNSATAANSIFIGTNAGRNDFVNNTISGTSILIGDNTSTGGFSNSIAMGASATNTRANQFLVASAYSHWSIRGIDYLMPSANALGVLTNDGSGNLSWGASVSQFQFLRNSANLTRTNSVTLTLVPGMTATVTAGKIYQFTATLLTTSGTGGGVKAAITLAGGATGTLAYQGITTQNGQAPTSSRAAASNIAVGAVTNVTTATIQITGTFVCTVGGVMRLTFGQNVANATSSVVLANSIFQVTQIN